jgi:hypothetical protein
VCEGAGFQGEAVGGISVVTVKGGDTDGDGRENGGIDKIGKVGDAFGTAHDMDEGMRA